MFWNVSQVSSGAPQGKAFQKFKRNFNPLCTPSSVQVLEEQLLFDYEKK